MILRGGKMELKEITPENKDWITQKALYAYETIRVGSLIVENVYEDEKFKPIYYYEIDGRVEELPDECKSWEEAEDVFLEVMFNHFEDEEHYYNDLKLMCDELMRERS